MGQLRGGTTIGGYTALHSGLKEAYMAGNLTLSGNITSSGDITAYSFKGNGNVGGTGSASYHPSGLYSTGTNWLYGQIITNNNAINAGSGNITAGTLTVRGQDSDARYLNLTGNYASFDLLGSTAYPRLVANNTGASTPGWIRVGDSGGGVGLLPYADNMAYLGTASWRFTQVHAVNFYESGASLSGKYLGISAKAADAALLDGLDNTAFMRSDVDDTFSGKHVASTRQAGIYGTYSSTLIDHIWSMGTAYLIDAGGANFGGLYGMAYKHTNNTTGGTMAGGHQIVFVNGGTPGAAIGLGGNIWTSGTIYEGGTALNTRYSALYHNHDTDYIKLTGGGTMYGTLAVGLTHGISFVTGTEPTLQSSGNWITGGADIANLTKANNVAIQTWNGFSVSSTITGQAVPKGVPSFSVDARNGHVRVLNDLAAGGNLVITADGQFGGTVLTNNLSGIAGSAVNFGTTGGSVNYASSMIRLQQSSNYIRIGNATTMDVVFASAAGTIFKFSTNPSDFGHATLNAGKATIKFLNASLEAIQVRNSADSAYAPVHASAFTVGSRRDTKKNIDPYELNGLEKIVSTPLYNYNYKNESDSDFPHLGVIYEESPVEIVDPSGVGIDTYSMTTLAWKAIQELAQENKELKERLSALEKRKQ